jgi:hypothetical protein
MVDAHPDRNPWVGFYNRHAGHPFLEFDPLYALTDDVVSALADEVPGFLTAENEAFERDLIRTTGSGFAHGYPIGTPAVPVDSKDPDRDFQELFPIRARPDRISELHKTAGRRMNSQQIRRLEKYLRRPPARPDKHICPALWASWQPNTSQEVLLDEIRAFQTVLRVDAGVSRQKSEWAEKQELHEVGVFRQKQESYAMWLALNKDFRREITQLLSKWQVRIRQLGFFPVHRLAANGISKEVREAFGEDCWIEFSELCQRWSIERLLSWDLPLPLNVRFDYMAAEDPFPDTFQRNGVFLFLPWHLLRGRQLDLTLLLSRRQIEGAPPAIDKWLDKASNRMGRGMGDIALQHKYWLYRSYYLVLLPRYGKECKGNVARIDQLLAKLMRRDVESVRKLRMSMVKDLRRLDSI